MTGITRRNALRGAVAVAATTAVPIAAMAKETAADPIVALDTERRRLLSIAFANLNTDLASTLFEKAAYLQIDMIETPATSIEGVARKLSLCCDKYLVLRQEELVKSAAMDVCRLAGMPAPGDQRR